MLIYWAKIYKLERKNTETLLMTMTTKEIGLEKDTEQTKYRFMSRKQNKGQSHNRKKQSRYRPGVAQSFPGSYGSQITWQGTGWW